MSGVGMDWHLRTPIQLDGTVAPTVAVAGDEFLCAGSTWTLTSSEGFSYLWSNGSTEPSIEVGESGQYTVQVEDQCGNFVASDAVEVTVFDGPTATLSGTPTLDGVYGFDIEVTDSMMLSRVTLVSVTIDPAPAPDRW